MAAPTAGIGDRAAERAAQPVVAAAADHRPVRVAPCASNTKPV